MPARSTLVGWPAPHTTTGGHTAMTVDAATRCGNHAPGTCNGYGTEGSPRHSSEEILAHRRLTEAQHNALSALCARYHAPFDPAGFKPAGGLMSPGWVEGWVGNSLLYVGCSPEGNIHS